jgi:hypothetical protein
MAARRLALALASVLALAAAVPARAEVVAVLQGLDKTTARISTIEAPVGQSVRFGSLLITVRACDKRPPEEPPETAAFLQIDDVKPGEGKVTVTRIFSGWMFKESPALSALEHPVYDVTVLDCRGTEADAAKPGEPAKPDGAKPVAPTNPTAPAKP